MNIRQLKYVIQLADVKSFSQLADLLKMSQPALSKHIKTIEDQLNVKLFNRETTPLTLTPAGEHFVKEARELVYQHEQLVSSMEKFRSGISGTLTIGISPFRSMCLIPRIMNKFKEKYPEVKILLHEASSDILRKEALDGKFDFAILNLPVDETAFDTILIEPDVMVLAVPNSMLDKIAFPKNFAGCTIDDFSICKNLPFVALSKTQELRVLLDKLCMLSDFYPIISAETNGGIATARSLMAQGLGATILPLRFIENENFCEDITIFKIANLSVRQPVVVTKKNQYIPQYAQYAIDLLCKETL